MQDGGLHSSMLAIIFPGPHTGWSWCRMRLAEDVFKPAACVNSGQLRELQVDCGVFKVAVCTSSLLRSCCGSRTASLHEGNSVINLHKSIAGHSIVSSPAQASVTSLAIARIISTMTATFSRWNAIDNRLHRIANLSLHCAYSSNSKQIIPFCDVKKQHPNRPLHEALTTRKGITRGS
ncbi:hypothetical protein AUEXF2481DRAFT_42205 [Aureobasidium subglaciale EXF-2481]|uniref:Uncharacterized protein n=1 Tax=Aureobasidium subglaciale (strain EXF-2481) TaxID=1043005 RepID=A0A074Z1Q3_AURSE|nr:uncharacterized protein AUEXF2481DRAFT_42205 [Aureobasidium subglaciale EXF-2481]KEQ93006.1 hypothetical protein AUEXF2481DRAFT_42205 [Aureobasidium subglaciale EXF-2481]